MDYCVIWLIIDHRHERDRYNAIILGSFYKTSQKNPIEKRLHDGIYIIKLLISMNFSVENPLIAKRRAISSSF